jgi:hypothetical protein
MAEQVQRYPVTFNIDYPDRNLDRLTTFFRLFTAIPIMLVLSFFVQSQHIFFVFLPTVVMILFRQKYPRWWFDWNVAMTKFLARIAAYLYMLTDVYPSTDEEQSVHINIPYPDATKDINRWLPLVKWLLAIPHYIVLYFMMIAGIVCLVISWFAILINGRFPRGMFDFIEGIMRWSMRVSAYMALLATDVYPPFSLD